MKLEYSHLCDQLYCLVLLVATRVGLLIGGSLRFCEVNV